MISASEHQKAPLGVGLAVVPAESQHAEFVAQLMQHALEPYYGGDHRAHARRIFEAHISGGEDTLGFFSKHQNMYILVSDDKPCGMLHLVQKRQSTVKISPLIVSPEYRGGKGAGATLLSFAVNYARERAARQLYCTVAYTNTKAINFFLRNGFVVAGSSMSHYKVGVSEYMLYKPLYSDEFEDAIDRPHISVLPFDEEMHGSQARSLLISELTPIFDGIDDTWVDGLFSGFRRRNTQDINQKFKLIFVAENRDGEVLGIAGATPKKGEPIKLMPLASKNTAAFISLLTDIPFALKPFGRKVYAHIVPDVEETVVLQQRGWELNAVLPGAYQPGIITQQWSIDVDKAMRLIRVKRQFVEAIKAGEKTLEVRVGYDHIKTIEQGEQIRFAARDISVVVEIEKVQQYKDFEELLEEHPFSSIAPRPSKEEVLALLREIYPPHKERLGVYAFSIKPVTNSS